MEPKQKKTKQQNTGLSKINPVEAKTENQKRFFQSYNNYQALSLSGFAGTGKSFVALAAALRSVDNGDYDNVLIIRSAVPSRDMGFMPGTKEEKTAVYESPYISICNKLYGRGDAYNILKQKRKLQFTTTSFLRGETFENCVVILDEMQNAAFSEIYTVLTRIGENCKIILIGDGHQDDLTSERFKEISGFNEIQKLLDLIPSCKKIEFDVDDIVRSGFVRELIIADNQIRGY